MEGSASSSYCERCGNAASIEAGTLHSCLQCDRFICTDCWDARRQRCADCAPLVLRASRARDLTLLRRVDRRLREVARDASTMPGKAHASDTSVIAAELAFLRLKAFNAGEIGEAPLVRRVRGAKATEVEAFARRIRRHIRLTDIAVARAERSTQAALDEPAIEVAHPQADTRGPGWRTLVVAAAAAAVAAAVVVVVLNGDLDVGLLDGRGGVLSGLPRDGSPVPSGSGGGTALSSPVSVDRYSQAFDFDQVRMGDGIGDAWGGHPSQAAAGSIQIAAFPTSFDRSARLTTGGQNVMACAAVEPQELQRIAFDVYLDPAVPAVGTLSLHALGDDAELEIVIDAEGPLSAHVPEDQLTPGPRIAAGAWRRVELIAEAGDLLWRVHTLEEPTTAPADGSFGPAALAPITRICLSADGPAGSAVSYDNIEIHGFNSGG